MYLANFIIVTRELTGQNLPHTSVVNIQSYISGVDTFCFHERLPCGLHVWNRTRRVYGFHVQSGQSSKSCYYLEKFLSSVYLFLCSFIFYLDKTITGKQLTTISNLSWWGKCSSTRTNHNLNITHYKGYSTLQRIAYCVRLSCWYGKYFGRWYAHAHLLTLPQTDWYRNLSDMCWSSSKDFFKINVVVAFAPIQSNRSEITHQDQYPVQCIHA